jgi:hypothetical protein
MEIILVLVVIAIGIAFYYNSKPASFDINKDGKVDVKDAVAAAAKVEEVVVTEVKAVAAKAKTAAKKVVAKKPAPAKKTVAKKSAAKKPKA